MADKCQKSEAEAKFVQFSELCRLVESPRLKYQQYLQCFYVFLITQHDFNTIVVVELNDEVNRSQTNIISKARNSNAFKSV